MEIRLQKFMAECGVASRRKAEEYIQKGFVKVNGKIVSELGTKIDPEVDSVEYIENANNENLTNIDWENSKKLSLEKKVYILLNKPVGYVTTVEDEHGRSTVMELLSRSKRKSCTCGKTRYVYFWSITSFKRWRFYL